MAKKKEDSPNKQATKKEAQPEAYDLSKFVEVVRLFKTEHDSDFINENIIAHISSLLKKYGIEKYSTILLYDEDSSISQYHADRIYEAISKNDNVDDIFLIIHSNGGRIEPAYLISKTCKRLSKNRFIVAVPRRAKSAATLIALGADEIHMGLMSELGPIDPQIGDYPALSLGNALDKIASLSSRFPGSAEMFSLYLTRNLNLNSLGYFERVSESAAQYAERLLMNKTFTADNTPVSLASRFVYHYKDHGFVIDVDETQSLLGDDVVKQNTPEYKCANEIYKFLDWVDFMYEYLKSKDFSYVGDVNNGIRLEDRKKSD